MSFKNKLNKDRIPNHVAIIMDGNGRWAQERGEHRIVGHQNGVTAVRQAVECAAEVGIKYLTLYAFSTENWSRPQEEVSGLMSLFVDAMEAEVPSLMKNNIRLRAIGDLKSLPEDVQTKLNHSLEQTESNTGVNLVLALSYSSRWELIDAMTSIAEKVEQGILKSTDINENTISSHLTTNDIPDPELLFRTSGESRLSNFLLWQVAYSELLFVPEYWPDFTKEKFCEALFEYQGRERRFGKTSEQVKVK